MKIILTIVLLAVGFAFGIIIPSAKTDAQIERKVYLQYNEDCVEIRDYNNMTRCKVRLINNQAACTFYLPGGQIQSVSYGPGF